jgi:hypothetical protein
VGTAQHRLGIGHRQQLTCPRLREPHEQTAGAEKECLTPSETPNATQTAWIKAWRERHTNPLTALPSGDAGGPYTDAGVAIIGEDSGAYDVGLDGWSQHTPGPQRWV